MVLAPLTGRGLQPRPLVRPRAGVGRVRRRRRVHPRLRGRPGDRRACWPRSPTSGSTSRPVRRSRAGSGRWADAGSSGRASGLGTNLRACAGSPSRATSRSRSRAPAGATASTARSPRIGRTCTRLTRSSGFIEEAVRRNSKELLVLTGEKPEVNPRWPPGCASTGTRTSPRTSPGPASVRSSAVCCRTPTWACSRPRGAGAAAGGHGVAGADARVGEPGARGAQGLADQAPGAAAGDDPAGGRAEDPVHHRHPGGDRRDARRARRRRSRRSRRCTPSTATCRR